MVIHEIIQEGDCHPNVVEMDEATTEPLSEYHMWGLFTLHVSHTYIYASSKQVLSNLGTQQFHLHRSLH